MTIKQKDFFFSNRISVELVQNIVGYIRQASQTRGCLRLQKRIVLRSIWRGSEIQKGRFQLVPVNSLLDGTNLPLVQVSIHTF